MFWFVLLLSVTVTTAVALVRVVRADGLGHRPPPPSCLSHVPGGDR